MRKSIQFIRKYKTKGGVCLGVVVLITSVILLLNHSSQAKSEAIETTSKKDNEGYEKIHDRSTDIQFQEVASNGETSNVPIDSSLKDKEITLNFLNSLNTYYEDFNTLEYTFRKNALKNNANIDLEVAETGVYLQQQLINLEPVDLQNTEHEKLVNDYYYYLINCYGGLISTSYSSYKREIDLDYTYKEHQVIADNFTLTSRELPSYRQKVIDYLQTQQ